MNRTLYLPRLRPDQSQIVNHPAKIKVLAMGRRWGKTVMSGAVALAAAAHSNKVAWVAPTYKQTRPLWRWAVAANAGVGTVSKTERMIDFGRGFLAVYTGDTPDSMRGESFNLLIIDEAAKIKDEVWTDILQPTLADYAGEAILISTPHGRNWFWREWQRGKNGAHGYASFSAPSADNPNPNIKRAAELARERVSERTYRQEWLAEFVEDGGGVFRAVRNCAIAQPTPADKARQYVAGLDWALSHDYTVLTIVDIATRAVVHVDRFNGVEYSLQRMRISEALKRYNAVCIAEANAMGKPNNDMLRAVGCRVRDFTTTNTTKSDAIESLASAFEQGNIKILNDAIAIGELESYESERLGSGAVKYGAPSGMHDDTVMSLALAWHGITEAARSDLSKYGW